MEKLKPPQTIIAIAGIVAFIASFLEWAEGFDGGLNAWSDELLFPTYTWIGIAGAIMALQVLLTTFSTVRFPPTVAGFNWKQIHLVLAFIALLLSISVLIAGEDLKLGFWLSLLASIGLMVGAVMLDRYGRAPMTGASGGSGLPPMS